MLNGGKLQPSLPFSLLCFSHRLPFSPSNIKSPSPLFCPCSCSSVLILSIFAQLKMQPLTAHHLRLDQPPPLVSWRSDWVSLLCRWFHLSLELNWQICISTIVAVGIGKNNLDRKKKKKKKLFCDSAYDYSLSKHTADLSLRQLSQFDLSQSLFRRVAHFISRENFRVNYTQLHHERIMYDRTMLLITHVSSQTCSCFQDGAKVAP